MIAGQVAKFNSVLRKAYSHVLLEQMERTFDHIIYNVYGREIKPLSHTSHQRMQLLIALTMRITVNSVTHSRQEILSFLLSSLSRLREVYPLPVDTTGTSSIEL